MVVFEIDGKEVRCPIALSELKTNVYERAMNEWDFLFTNPSLIKLFSSIVGVKFDKMAESSDPEVEVAFFKTVNLIVNDSDLESLPVPRVIKIGDKLVEVPTKFNKLTLGQNIMIKRKLSTDFRISISYMLAVYLEPLYSGIKWDEESDTRVDELEKIIGELPITTTYPIGSFFMKGRTSYGLGLFSFLPRIIRTILRLLIVKKYTRQPSLTY